MKVKVNDKEYIVHVAITDEEKIQGLQGVTELPENSGMLFIYDEPQTVGFWMEDTPIPLDIIFINEDEEVISVFHGKPNDRTIAEEDDVKYVLEVNAKSGIKAGDEVELDSAEIIEIETKMLVIGPDGGVQMRLEGGERIFSRPNTKTLVSMAKRAYTKQSDASYRALGKKIFKFLDQQDNNKPEYVASPT